MKSFIPFLIIFSIIIVFIDLYTYRGFRSIIIDTKPEWQTLLKWIFWSIPFILLSGILIWILFTGQSDDYKRFAKMYWLTGFLILFYVPKLVFILFAVLQDFSHFFAEIFKNNSKSGGAINQGATAISRSNFLIQTGLLIAAIPFFSIIHGIAFGRFNFKIRNIILDFSNLPEAFHGLKVVQISDLHIGSFQGQKEQVEIAIKKVNDQNADFIFFTGDIVNNIADELDEWVPILSTLKSKYGKFSILGNHDYGSYYRWKKEEDKERNLQKLKDLQKKIGFDLLLNQAVELEKRGQKIGLIGVENWGLPPFPQYGDLQKAEEKVKDLPFKILLSHDPTHWSEVVLKESNIDLTLSGHTHGMQFGIEIPGFIRWSPVKFKYKNWAGLYKQKNQFLYVNIGLGYIGFPGRVGMPPEITVIEFHKKQV